MDVQETVRGPRGRQYVRHAANHSPAKGARWIESEIGGTKAAEGDGRAPSECYKYYKFYKFFHSFQHKLSIKIVLPRPNRLIVFLYSFNWITCFLLWLWELMKKSSEFPEFQNSTFSKKTIHSCFSWGSMFAVRRTIPVVGNAIVSSSKSLFIMKLVIYSHFAFFCFWCRESTS